VKTTCDLVAEFMKANYPNHTSCEYGGLNERVSVRRKYLSPKFVISPDLISSNDYCCYGQDKQSKVYLAPYRFQDGFRDNPYQQLVISSSNGSYKIQFRELGQQLSEFLFERFDGDDEYGYSIHIDVGVLKNEMSRD